ncbi:MAG: glycoside hydrolase family 88 protein [Bacteroides sp.]|nr:glycoside hydrolase family 88 protein [Bacteroides sp.]
MAAYRTTGNVNYLRYSQVWAERNAWKGCQYAYIDLYKAYPEEHKISDLCRLMAMEPSVSKATDERRFSQDVSMWMPVLVELYGVTGNIACLDRLHKMFDAALISLYDVDTSLFVCNNSRILASMALVIERLPLRDAYRERYLRIYSSVARALFSLQQSDGHWNANISESDSFSVTALIAFSYLWGIRHDLLPGSDYTVSVARAWAYLSASMDAIVPLQAGDAVVPSEGVAPLFTDLTVGSYLWVATEMLETLRTSNRSSALLASTLHQKSTSLQ